MFDLNRILALGAHLPDNKPFVPTDISDLLAKGMLEVEKEKYQEACKNVLKRKKV